MCELAFMSPDDRSIVETMDLLRDMFEKNNDGLGIVAIYRDGESYDYKTLKYHVPEWMGVLRFVARHQDAWRFAIHARLATAGGVGVEEAHPINVDCEKCDIGMVMHNGVVYNDISIRNQKKRIGHEFETSVDTEVIAHSHREIPDDIEDVEEPTFRGKLNYFLFEEDKILIRAGYGYHLDSSPKIAKRHRKIVKGGGRDTTWLLLTPDGETQTKEAEKSRVVWYGGRTSDGDEDDESESDAEAEACVADGCGCEEEQAEEGGSGNCYRSSSESPPYADGFTDEEYEEYERSAETYPNDRPVDCMCTASSQYVCGPCYTDGFRTINPEVMADIREAYTGWGHF